MSLCRRHFERTVAAREATAAVTAAPGASVPGTLGERMLTLLRMHQAKFDGIMSLATKIEAKREALPDYEAYVDGVLASGSAAQDDVLVWVMLWRLDVGDFDGALEIAAHAIRHGLSMPFNFARDVPTTLVESIANAAVVDPEHASPEPLRAALALTADRDMHDQVRAKAHKALGLILSATDKPAALDHFEAALKLDPKCGVKTARDKLRKELEAANPAS
jgi:hypothetical protein